jgi:hypothetical protein
MSSANVVVKSSFCNADGCAGVRLADDGESVEVGRVVDGVFSPRVVYTAAEWDVFLAGAMRGEFTRRALKRNANARELVSA